MVGTIPLRQGLDAAAAQRDFVDFRVDWLILPVVAPIG